jgi:HD-GYP domain-containing protein (c-di-GMP phosphodiesterase class II)
MTTVDFGAPLTLAPVATAGRRPCAVCGLTYLRALAAEHHLCPHCAEDLPAARAHVDGQLAAAEGRIAEHQAAMAAQLEDVPDELWERFGAMRAAHAAAVQAVRQARVARYAASVPVEVRAEAVRSAQARLDEVEAKIARTEARVPELAALIGNWRAWSEELRRLHDERTRWRRAADEVTCAEDRTPF